MLTLSQINIYPVKSLDGYSPESATVEMRGLQHDRRWMITDADGLFFSQRTKRRMALLRARVVGEKLIIEEKNNLENNIVVSIHQESDPLQVQVWDDSVLAKKVSDEADAFLSAFLQIPCHLVKMPAEANRRVEEDYNRGDDVVSFADGYPYLVIGESSIKDLNGRLKTPLNTDNQELEGMRRFRTNFVFKGGQPYEEESWGRFRIGEVHFQGMKPCGRCVMTTLNPDTGERSNEPLATLATYRQKGKKIPFGQNVVWRKEFWKWAFAPEVKVGDAICIE